jgi:2-polyprenyl-3-methyl-5-hydroxy-6-metoxy-1,4-benzoquinol methylase
MSQNEFVLQIKKAHDEYYSGIDGPIGGNDRFLWVVDKFSREWAGLKILEIGCGEGSLLELLSRRNEVHGADVSSSGVEIVRRKGITCHHIDASNEKLPYQDNYFDIVITLETIEHVENPHRMVWEIKRLLKPGGTLLISIPGEGVNHPFIYPGLFTRRKFKKFLTVNGFDVNQIRGWGQCPLMAHWVDEIRQKNNKILKRISDIVFYLGRKRNLIFRKRLKMTPISMAHTLNFLCSNSKREVSIVEEVAKRTTPH